jgi:hypothetical protein
MHLKPNLPLLPYSNHFLCSVTSFQGEAYGDGHSY